MVSTFLSLFSIEAGDAKTIAAGVRNELLRLSFLQLLLDALQYQIHIVRIMSRGCTARRQSIGAWSYCWLCEMFQDFTAVLPF